MTSDAQKRAIERYKETDKGKAAQQRAVRLYLDTEQGQDCDGSGDACCAALYHDFCIRHGLNPLELYRLAYLEHDGASYCDPDYAAILQQANWQGVEYPQRWGGPELGGLLNSLNAINNRSLVQVLEGTPPFLQGRS